MDKLILESLNNRYATKKFDSSRKLTSEQIDVLSESARLTATSYGLQLMKLVIVEDQSIKDQLKNASYNQNQVSDASHVLVLCRERKLDLVHIEKYIENIAKTREVEINNLEDFKNAMAGNLLKMSPSEVENWMSKQVYICLGKLLTVCALLNIDSCPMEGFDANEYSKILNLEKENLTAVLVLPVGIQSKDDPNANSVKVRRSPEDFILKI